MVTSRHRAVYALAVFVGWALITILFDRLWVFAVGNHLIAGIEPNYIAAAVFLFIVIGAFGWRDIGLNPPNPVRSLRLLWLPAAYVAVFFGLLPFVGLPAPHVVFAIFVNTTVAGISEELACRGVLYQGLRSRMSMWPAILVSTALFAVGHLANGFVYGSFVISGVQSVAAFMTGIVFMAIRIRARSLYPGMVLHALWDFSLLTLASKTLDQALSSGGLAAGLSAAMLALPVLGILPNFLYGLYLLRSGGRDEHPLPEGIDAL